MKNINQETRRRQNMTFLAVLVALAGVGGAGWLYLDYTDHESKPGVDVAPAPDMTGVVDENLTGKVQTAAIEEAQKLNKQTMARMNEVNRRLDELMKDNRELREKLASSGANTGGAGK